MTLDQNVLNLIAAFKKTGQSDEVIKQSLFTNGCLPEVVDFHLDYYNKNFGKNIKENKNNMKLTLIDLYENIEDSLERLHRMSNDQRFGYSAKLAGRILENAVDMLSISKTDADVMKAQKQAGKEVDESIVNPILKYRVAENLYSALQPYTNIVAVEELTNKLVESFRDDKWSYVASSVAESIATKTQNAAYAKLYEGIKNLLIESKDLRSDLKSLMLENVWNNGCKNVVSMIISEEKAEAGVVDERIYENNKCKVCGNITPIMEDENGTTFFLNGKNYIFDGKQLVETRVDDIRYNNVLAGLALMEFNDAKRTLTYHGVKGLDLHYNVDTEHIDINETTDLSNLGLIDLSEAIKRSGLFNRDTIKDCEVLCKFFESRDMLTDLDICTTISPETAAGVFITIMNVDEGVYVNTVNYPMGINDMTKYNTATDACKAIKEYVGYDASAILQEKLIKEGKQQAVINDKRAAIQDNLNFLYDQKKRIEEAIKYTNGTDASLEEARKLVNGEIYKFEKQLQETYMEQPVDAQVVDYDKDKMLKNGYTEVTVAANCDDCGVNEGDKVLVSAEEFANLDDAAQITAFKEDGTSILIPKANLKVEI
jgi:hypothetical protein